jgi:hypothetical protein
MRALQHLDGRLQVDDQVRHGRVDRQPFVDLLVQRVLLVVERDAREQAVLVEQEVGDAHGREQVGLLQRLHLPRALEQEDRAARETRSRAGCGRSARGTGSPPPARARARRRARRRAGAPGSSCRRRSVPRSRRGGAGTRPASCPTSRALRLAGVSGAVATALDHGAAGRCPRRAAAGTAASRRGRVPVRAGRARSRPEDTGRMRARAGAGAGLRAPASRCTTSP